MTKHSDLFQLSPVRGAPPKVVWVCMGNAPATTVTSLLFSHLADIYKFLNDDTSIVLAVGR